MALVDVIKWNASPNVFAWKFPSEELSTKTQLIVSESQEAILVNQGRFVGPFSAGRHTLSTENYPILNEILKLPFGGKTPFSAEVWFIQKAFSLEIKWGTLSPIQIEDPKYHIFIPIRAFGQYGIQISDSKKFLLKLVGTLPVFVRKTLEDFFIGIVLKHANDLLAKYFVEKNISIIQVSANIREISDKLCADISNELDEYGVRITNFNINSISTDETDPSVARIRRALAERVEMDILNFNYQQKRTFDTMEAAASNQGGNSLMNAGIGMGIGYGMGIPMGNIANQMTENLNTTKVTPKFCSNCGTSLSGNAKFCPECGTKIN